MLFSILEVEHYPLPHSQEPRSLLIHEAINGVVVLSEFHARQHPQCIDKVYFFLFGQTKRISLTRASLFVSQFSGTGGRGVSWKRYAVWRLSPWRCWGRLAWGLPRRPQARPGRVSGKRECPWGHHEPSANALGLRSHPSVWLWPWP